MKLKESGSVVENVDEDEFEPVCPGVGGKCARSCATMISSARKVKF